MIHFQNVTKLYAGTPALNNVTFTVQAGIITALVGHNGAGKTTSLRLMVGLLTPEAGRVSVLGLDPHRQGLKVRQQVCYLSDTPFTSPHLTGEEHLQFQADVYRQPQALYRAKQLAERYRLSKALGRPVSTYSHGMVQRLALIRTLMIETPVLLLDEPFNALDPLGISLLAADLKGRATQGHSVLVSSHLLAMLQGFAQEVVVMKQGLVVYSGSIDGIDWSAHMDEWFSTELNEEEEDMDSAPLLEELEEEEEEQS